MDSLAPRIRLESPHILSLDDDRQKTYQNVCKMTNDTNEQDSSETDFCRVCRSEAGPDRPLFYPCVCTGSIKYIHQDCLTQWLKYSRKDTCELCKHKFHFAPIYHPDMPTRLPIKDLLLGLLKTLFKAIRYWFHYTLVGICWIVIVPLTASRIYRCLFTTGSVSALFTLPFDMLSTENILSDVIQGGFVVFCSLGAFICLLWLREQIVSGQGPEWLQEVEPPAQPHLIQGQQNAQATVDEVLPSADEVPLSVDEVGQNLPANNNERQGSTEEFTNNHIIQEAINNSVERELSDYLPETDTIDGDSSVPVGEQEQYYAIADRNEAEPIINNPADDGVDPVLPVVAAQAPVENHWNPVVDWGAPDVDLTWERLLGLDGSLQFLEHVFWVVSLNTLFILVFAYIPYHLGNYFTNSLSFKQAIKYTKSEGLITTLISYGCIIVLIGYVIISFLLLILFTFLTLMNRFNRLRRLIGLCYIVIKVALLVVIEILLFPLICGIWLDICSLRILNESSTTLNDRILNFQMSPGTSSFLHWLVGMIYVFYFATFIFLLREILRPGTLWFLKSVNDIDFNPIHEMIVHPVGLHIRRFITSIIIFGCCIILMFYIPGEFLNRFVPKFLPYNIKGNLETVVSELMIEFILLQGILPTLLEQGQTRTWLKLLIQYWVEFASYVLGLRSYLLGDDDEMEAENTRNIAVNQHENNLLIVQPPPPPVVAAPLNIGQAHQQLLQANHTETHQPLPYRRPTYFRLRLFGLFLFICLSLTIFSLIGLILPATIGRILLSYMTGSSKLHELYTILSGLYVIWLIARLFSFIRSLLPLNIGSILIRLKSYAILSLRDYYQRRLQ
ncbi:unnamed protein product [Didymodactylos carnosus]|uniref:RING-type E3 ubiquitin transferase n=1 Tax=Didymodactylos carnosus TaxID=1234261 RepID=A0A813W532_9BILA|nr:unnamed protein product [Didymodactylos carnosus]CAF0948065.1 unnamed protein product [Didymodactylos carnosus]CAF3635874.1 unnamed protein product [Didymodactylos carnosus]CAF3722502.1 unnamed protein product [Didymodactylos carnosus]